MGIDAETVRPPAGQVDGRAPKIRPKIAPVTTAFGVNSATRAWSGT